MEQPIVRGVTASLTDVLITVAGGGEPLSATARVLRTAARLGVPVGTVAPGGGRDEPAFTVPRRYGAVLAAALEDAGRVRLDEEVAEVALLGAGLRSAPATAATFCEALARAGVRLAATSFENHRLAALCPRPALDRAVGALCEVFEVGLLDAGPLDAEPQPLLHPTCR